MPDRAGTVSPSDEMRAGCWVRSCNGASGCVEVSYDRDTGLVRVRDSKDPGGPTLVFSEAEWRTFLEGVKAGRFDLAAVASGGNRPRSPLAPPLADFGAVRLPD